MIEIKGAEKYVEFRSLEAGCTPGRGWTLIAMYSEDHPQTVGSSHWDNQRNVQVPAPVVSVSKAYAIYGRTRDEVIEDLESTNAQVRAECDTKSAEVRDLKDKLEKSQKALEATQRNEFHYKAQRDSVDISLSNATTSLRAMETDLGKVRDAVGGDRFKEILGRSTVKG